MEVLEDGPEVLWESGEVKQGSKCSSGHLMESWGRFQRFLETFQGSAHSKCCSPDVYTVELMAVRELCRVNRETEGVIPASALNKYYH